MKVIAKVKNTKSPAMVHAIGGNEDAIVSMCGYVDVDHPNWDIVEREENEFSDIPYSERCLHCENRITKKTSPMRRKELKHFMAREEEIKKWQRWTGRPRNAPDGAEEE